MRKQQIENKGVVVKVTESSVVVLFDDGTFENIPRENGEFPGIGETYFRKPSIGRSFTGLKYGSLVSALLLVIIGLMSLFSFQNPKAAYVLSMDVNPGIEFYLDEQMKVIKIDASNADGEEIVDLLQQTKGSFRDVVNKAITEMTAAGYLDPTKEEVVTATVIPLNEDAKQISQTVKDIISKSIAGAGGHAEVTVSSADKKLLKAARGKNVSVNRLRMYKEVKERGSRLTLDEVRVISVRELADLVKGHKDDNPLSQPDNQSNEDEEPSPDSGKSHNENKEKNEKPARSSENGKNGKQNAKQVGKKTGEENQANRSKDRAEEKQNTNRSKGNDQKGPSSEQGNQNNHPSGRQEDGENESEGRQQDHQNKPENESTEEEKAPAENAKEKPEAGENKQSSLKDQRGKPDKETERDQKGSGSAEGKKNDRKPPEFSRGPDQ